MADRPTAKKSPLKFLTRELQDSHWSVIVDLCSNVILPMIENDRKQNEGGRPVLIAFERKAPRHGRLDFTEKVKM